MTPAGKKAYCDAYASEAARAWIESMPAAVRKEAEKKGLLKPKLDAPIYSISLNELLTRAESKPAGNDFDESDFAFAAVERGGNLDGIRAEFYAAAEPEESPEE